jgi:hypothetical protein
MMQHWFLSVFIEVWNMGWVRMPGLMDLPGIRVGSGGFERLHITWKKS